MDRFTRKELEQKFGPNLMAKLLATIEHGLAPEEPTDEEINEAIAKAQGWQQHWHRLTSAFHGPGESRWAKEGEWIVSVDDYQPVANLGQAIDAIQGIGAAAEVKTYISAEPGYPVTLRMDGIARTKWCKDSKEAAGWLSRHLYDRIQRNTGQWPGGFTDAEHAADLPEFDASTRPDNEGKF